MSRFSYEHKAAQLVGRNKTQEMGLEQELRGAQGVPEWPPRMCTELCWVHRDPQAGGSLLSVSSAAQSSWDQAPLSTAQLGKSGFVCSPSQLSQLPRSAGLSGSKGTE